MSTLKKRIDSTHIQLEIENPGCGPCCIALYRRAFLIVGRDQGWERKMVHDSQSGSARPHGSTFSSRAKKNKIKLEALVVSKGIICAEVRY
jgi:hypothetical protein